MEKKNKAQELLDVLGEATDMYLMRWEDNEIWPAKIVNNRLFAGGDYVSPIASQGKITVVKRTPSGQWAYYTWPFSKFMDFVPSNNLKLWGLEDVDSKLVAAVKKHVFLDKGTDEEVQKWMSNKELLVVSDTVRDYPGYAIYHFYYRGKEFEKDKYRKEEYRYGEMKFKSISDVKRFIDKEEV